jgi:hypothetical protein
VEAKQLSRDPATGKLDQKLDILYGSLDGITAG